MLLPERRSVDDTENRNGVSPRGEAREYLTQVNHKIPSELLEPFDYVWEKKGKGIRSTLMSAFNLWLNIPAEKLVAVDHVISMLHNASLM